jgi:hypothetical protein
MCKKQGVERSDAKSKEKIPLRKRNQERKCTGERICRARKEWRERERKKGRKVSRDWVVVVEDKKSSKRGKPEIWGSAIIFPFLFAAHANFLSLP